jgi:hypothetical protein
LVRLTSVGVIFMRQRRRNCSRRLFQLVLFSFIAGFSCEGMYETDAHFSAL